MSIINLDEEWHEKTKEELSEEEGGKVNATSLKSENAILKEKLRVLEKRNTDNTSHLKKYYQQEVENNVAWKKLQETLENKIKEMELQMKKEQEEGETKRIAQVIAKYNKAFDNESRVWNSKLKGLHKRCTRLDRKLEKCSLKIQNNQENSREPDEKVRYREARDRPKKLTKNSDRNDVHRHRNAFEAFDAERKRKDMEKRVLQKKHEKNNKKLPESDIDQLILKLYNDDDGPKNLRTRRRKDKNDLQEANYDNPKEKIKAKNENCKTIDDIQQEILESRLLY